MRYAPLLVWLGTTLGFIACDTGSSITEASGCGSGLESCGTHCVPQGTCIGNSGGATGSGGATVDTSPITSTACTDTASTSGTIAQQYGGITLGANGGKQYYLSSNWWGKYNGQTVAYSGLSFTIHNPNGVASSDNNPIGYPTMYIGSYSGHDNAGSNLPKQVSAIASVPTVFSTNAAEGARDQYNAAYDVWFTPTGAKLGASDYAPPAGGAYLMVWMFKPTLRQPRGSVRQATKTISGLAGTWNVWVDASNPPCISYVAANPINGLDFDLNAFIQDAVTSKYGITSSQYLSVVFAGFEIWSGGEGLKVNNFCAKVN